MIGLQRLGLKDPQPIGSLIPDFDDRQERAKKGEIVFWKPNVQALKDMLHMEEVDFMLVVGEPGTGKSSYLRHEAIETAMMGQEVFTLTVENS